VHVVPTYEYHCDGCGRDFEVKQRISEEPLKTHDGCGGAVRRLLSAAPFILKGEGWYVTDYPSESRKKAMSSEKPAEKSTTEKTEKSASAGDGASTSSSAPSGPAAPSSATPSTPSTPSD
jgi:putative FmdB family regulatory protein